MTVNQLDCFHGNVEDQICWQCTAEKNHIPIWLAKVRYGIPWRRLFSPYTKLTANKYSCVYVFGCRVYEHVGDMDDFRLGPLTYKKLYRLHSISLFSYSVMWRKECTVQ